MGYVPIWRPYVTIVDDASRIADADAGVLAAAAAEALVPEDLRARGPKATAARPRH